MFSLTELGWSSFFEKQAQPNTPLIPARVAEESRELYHILCEQGEFPAELSGKLRHEIESRAGMPAVGDWVLAGLRPHQERATIHRVLERKGRFSRKMAGRKTEERIVAANIDVAFLVSSLNREFNLRRVERYLTLAWDSGAKPLIVLNKVDLSNDHDRATLRGEAEKTATGVPVILTSAACGHGVDELRAILQPGVTAAFLGSSGVGKSSLINALLGTRQLATQAIRASDDRGRHTTTTRQLLLLPRGGIVIDTPGMRELQLWDAREGLDQTFADIEELATGCRFRDCRHQSEPGCAVRAAVQAETLDARRLQSFHKLQKEERFLEAKQDAAVRSQRTKELRRMMKSVNRFYRDRGR